MKVRAHVFIRGTVQGVCFRSGVRDRARDLNVRGWVKNRPDGKVEAVFEGERFAVLELTDFCRRGPPGAHVKDLELKWEPSGNGFSTFEVRY
jgi:acylphosphatase